MENIAIVALENEFVVNIMEPTLQPRSSVMISGSQQEYARLTSIEGSS